MTELFIKGTAQTPEIDFRPEENYFLISGRSTPDDADIYYYPVIKYMQILKKELQTTPGKPLLFEFKFVYYNSVSIRYLNTLMQNLEMINEIVKVNIKWYYDTDDEYLQEMAEYFKDMFSLDIEMMPQVYVKTKKK